MTTSVIDRDRGRNDDLNISRRRGRTLAWARETAGGSLHPPVLTGALIAAVVATAVRLGVFAHELELEPTYRWGFSGSGLLAGGWSTLASSQFLTRDVFMAVSIPVSLAVMLGAYEALRGTTRALIVAAASAAAGPGLVTAALGIGSALNVEFASRTLQTLDYGASAMTAGGGGALVAVVRNRWLTRGAVAFVASGLVVHHELADWEHLAAFPVGFVAARLMDRWHPLARSARGSRHERGVPGRIWACVCCLVALVSGWVFASAAFSVTSAVTVVVGSNDVGAKPGVTVSTVAPGPPSPARIIDVRYPTPSLGGDRRVLVLLPAGYDSSGATYPVVEMLHGRPGGPDDIFTGLGLLAVAPTVAPFIAVVPDGHGPVVADGDFADTSKQRLGAALADDLQAWVNANYRSNGRWSVMGLSAGGFGAAYLATRATAHYDAVCALSGNFVAQDPPFAGESAAVRDAASPIKHVSALGPRTLLVAGRQDAESLVEAKAYAAAMATVGQSHDTVILDGGHDWSFFRAGTPTCLSFLLRS